MKPHLKRLPNKDLVYSSNYQTQVVSKQEGEEEEDE